MNFFGDHIYRMLPMDYSWEVFSPILRPLRDEAALCFSSNMNSRGAHSEVSQIRRESESHKCSWSPPGACSSSTEITCGRYLPSVLNGLSQHSSNTTPQIREQSSSMRASKQVVKVIQFPLTIPIPCKFHSIPSNPNTSLSYPSPLNPPLSYSATPKILNAVPLVCSTRLSP